ncbi:MAG: LamG domain-containing protein [Thermoguttaceae bacterium]
MNRLLLACCLSMLLAGGSLSAAELAGHWDFTSGGRLSGDGLVVEDLSGHGRDAAIRFAQVRPGDGSKALGFNGYLAHGEIPGAGSVDFAQGLTIAAWFNPDGLRANNLVFGKPNANAGFTTPMAGLFAPEEGRIGLGLWTSPKTILVSPSPTPAGAWTFVAGTWDGKTARLYIDGRCVAEQPVAGPVASSEAPLTIGAGTAGNRFFAGMIASLRLYRGALAAAEVQKLYEEDAGKFPRVPAAPAEAAGTVVVRSKVKPDSAWRDHPTRTLDLLDGYRGPKDPVELSAYGGWVGKRFKATGFFRAERIGSRWWLIDPEGYRFIHVGVATVAVGSSENMRKAFAEKFGDDKTWAAETKRLLRELNFNGTGGWADHERLGLSGERMPYVVRMSLMSGFGKKLGVTHAVPGHTGFELECIPVFHPDFAAYCRQEAQVLASVRDDAYVVGIYSDNELQTPKLENYLKLDRNNPAQRPNYEAALAWLRQRKGRQDVSPADVTMMDRLEFAGYAFDRYFRIVTEAIRGVDPNHLYIGSRLMSPNFQNPFVWKAAAPYCDVVAVNYYSCWGPRLDEVAFWQTLCPRPILITEFYVKGEDSGLPNTTGAGWIVPTQADRGRFYQHYVLGLLESGSCVGWHWFKYQDNDPEQKGAELSNIDSNKGIVDIRYRPYGDLVEAMKAINGEVYPLTEYFDAFRDSGER